MHDSITLKVSDMTHACNCLGPRNGQPMCPCAMRANGVIERDGRWIQPERDLGEVRKRRDDEDFDSLSTFYLDRGL